MDFGPPDRACPGSGPYPGSGLSFAGMTNNKLALMGHGPHALKKHALIKS